MSNADGALLFRNDGKILAVMLDAEAPAAAYGCFCVSWAVWCEKTTVFVFNDGTASFSGVFWLYQLHRPLSGTRYVDAGRSRRARKAIYVHEMDRASHVVAKLLKHAAH